MAKLITICPSCGGELKVKRLECGDCGVTVSGNFETPILRNLTRKQLEFVETFLKARGSIKEVEKLLGISYPTVRSRLDEVLKALELYEETGPRPKDILQKVSDGELSVEDAVEVMKGKKNFD